MSSHPCPRCGWPTHCALCADCEDAGSGLSTREESIEAGDGLMRWMSREERGMVP